jgi:hypothetical protein
MARSIEEIKQSIKTEIRTYPSLNSFLFPEDTPTAGSKTSVFNLMIHSVAVAMFTFEVIADSLRDDIQEIADAAPSGNQSWLRQQILDFQFGDTVTIETADEDDPNDFVPVYYPVTPANKIVTQCSVSDGQNGIVIVKVAKGTAPTLTPLSGAELTALQDYYFGTGGTQGVGFAGVNAQFVNLDSDRLFVEANIYFYGQFVQATVKANIITAMDNFLATFTDDNFGGAVFMIKLVDAIQAVDGVSRVELVSVKARPNSTPFVSAITVSIQGVYQTDAGHIIQEDTVGETFDDKITMIEETL